MIDSMDQLDPTPDRVDSVNVDALAEEAKPKKKSKDKPQEQPFARLVELPRVHYVLPSGDNRGACRPAIVTDVLSLEDGIVDVQVFTNGVRDCWGIPGMDGFLRGESVHYSAEKEPDTWHWSTEH